MINAVTQAGVYGAINQQPNIEQLGGGGANISFKLPKAPEHVVPVDGQTQGIVENQIAEPTSWGQMVHRMVLDTNDAQVNAGAKINDVISGGDTPIHEAMVSMQEASVKFALLSEVRNKMVEAYQEIMRMQV